MEQLMVAGRQVLAEEVFTDRAELLMAAADVLAVDRVHELASLDELDALSAAPAIGWWPEGPDGAATEPTDEQLTLLLARARLALVVRGVGRDRIEPIVPGSDIYPLRLADGTTGSLVLHPPPALHPRDFRVPAWNDFAAKHPNPLRLAALRVAARASITFYPEHEPRVWEYPSVAELVFDLVPEGSRIGDIGAGVSPLAPYLTTLGYRIDTIDPSPNRRVWPPRPDWNEWDYLDYAAVGMAEASFNTTLQHLPQDRRFDALYCVSVIEHLLASDRRELLAESARRLEPGGVLILTVDLVRDSNALWNQNRGAAVEAPALHGTFEDLAREIEEAGFELLATRAVRDWYDGPVDIGLYVARLPTPKGGGGGKGVSTL